MNPWCPNHGSANYFTNKALGPLFFQLQGVKIVVLHFYAGCSQEENQTAILPQCGSQISNFEKDVEKFLVDSKEGNLDEESKKRYASKFSYHRQQIKLYRSENPLSQDCLDKYQAIKLKLELDSSLKKHNIDKN